MIHVYAIYKGLISDLKTQADWKWRDVKTFTMQMEVRRGKVLEWEEGGGEAKSGILVPDKIGKKWFPVFEQWAKDLWNLLQGIHCHWKEISVVSRKEKILTILLATNKYSDFFFSFTGLSMGCRGFFTLSGPCTI